MIEEGVKLIVSGMVILGEITIHTAVWIALAVLIIVSLSK